MFDSLLDLLTHNDWAYLVVFAIAALDAVVPVVPSETAVVTAAALAMTGDLSLTAVVAAGASGALLGDNAAYALGRFSAPVARRASVGRRSANVRRARDALRTRTGTIVVVSRFVPGGRTVTMVAAGLIRVPWTRFVRVDLVGATVWASYSAGLGAIGGLAFRDRPLDAVGLGLGLALAIAAVAELVRRRRHRYGKAARTAGKGPIPRAGTRA